MIGMRSSNLLGSKVRRIAVLAGEQDGLMRTCGHPEMTSFLPEDEAIKKAGPAILLVTEAEELLAHSQKVPVVRDEEQTAVPHPIHVAFDRGHLLKSGRPPCLEKG